VPEGDVTAEQAEFLALARARGLRVPRDRFLDRGLRRLAAFAAAGQRRERTAARPHRLARVQPRARVLAVLGFLVSLSLAASLPALLAHALVPAALIPLVRIRAREVLAAGLLLAALSAALMAAPASLNLLQDGEVVLPLLARPEPWRLGPFAMPAVIGVSREGLLGLATLVVRVAASAAMVLWLSLSTRWTELLAALRSLTVPALVVQVGGMAVRYLHVLLGQAEELHLAKRSRTVCRRPLRAEQAWAGSRLGGLWLRGEHLMQEVGDAMTARGFTGDLRLPGGGRLSAADRLFLAAVAAACLGAHAL
jgi:energy-coupling factor transporter transmembrane protein EcfT